MQHPALTSNGFHPHLTLAPHQPQKPAAALHGNKRSFATARAVTALILREMSTRYGRSPGGYVWALLEPLGMIIVLSVAFAVLLRSPPLGNSFILFYATGYLPFNLYQILQMTISRSIQFSTALLQYPAVTWVDAVLARFILNSLTGILVTIILIAAILALTDTRTVVDLGPIVEAIALAMLVGIGIGVLNCALIGLVDVWGQVWAIATRPLFLISGIFYLYEDLPKLAKDILWWNPLIHITSIMREGFYPYYKPDFVSLPYVLAWGIVPLFLGIVLLARYHRDILARR